MIFPAGLPELARGWTSSAREPASACLSFRAAVATVCCVLAVTSSPRTGGAEVDFARQVQPLLADRCLACHGPDEASREAGLRLDTLAGATADLGGYRAIAPGDPEASELIRRIASDDPGEVMPPPEAGPPLRTEEIELLRGWIAAGAAFQQHWAFVPPRRPALPSVETTRWPRNAIDSFVLSRIESAGLTPSPPADPYTLVRRVYLDLTGLPPSPEQADAFAADPDPEAYEKLVDRLLQSPRYGERWARLWLDLARYSDTNGYEKDRPRSIWPYRDWVIAALNQDMPFDQFTLEQLAGDMLPGATASQRIATGFHRNTMLNEEGGIDPLEFRFYAMVDRVATTGTVWLGLTVGCAQCHTHKFDPISHTDYYRFLALLNNADEPDLQVRDRAVMRRRRAIEARITVLEDRLAEQFPPGPGAPATHWARRDHLQARFAEWLRAQRSQATRWTVLRPAGLETNLPKLELLPDGSIFSSGDITKRDVYRLSFRLDDQDVEPDRARDTEQSASGGTILTRVTALRLEVLPDPRLPGGGPGRAYYEGRKGDFFLSEVRATLEGEPIAFVDASHSYGNISIGSGDARADNVIDGEGSTGWSTAGGEGRAHQLVLNVAQPLVAAGTLEVELTFERHFAASLGRFRWSATDSEHAPRARQLPPALEELLAGDPLSWSVAERERLRQYFLAQAPELAAARACIQDLRERLPDLPTTLVLDERPGDNPRPTHRHHRGEYLSPREEVTAGLPEFLRTSDSPPADASAARSIAAGTGDTALPSSPTDRLSLARWLVSAANPLGARVAVNRAWQAFFGQGLVATAGDFGTQGRLPTHPDLLDWLACELMRADGRAGANPGSVDRGRSLAWSIKRLHRLIVTSATYRQDSRITEQADPSDPENRWLARYPRQRLDAEMIRDLALRVSGLLSERLGGPSVFPPQPASVTALAYGATAWEPSHGSDRYRRSLYTFSKRTAPFAAYQVFDAPTGENCAVQRQRSNTPLQALTLLNDEMYLEMARALADREMRTRKAPAARVRFLLRSCITRPPGQAEVDRLLDFYRQQLHRLQRGQLSAAAIAADALATPDRAAWVMVARAVLNLDESITKP
jgi:hypothetical protein